MTIEEATNVTLEDAIKCFEHTIFPQDFSPTHPTAGEQTSDAGGTAGDARGAGICRKGQMSMVGYSRFYRRGLALPPYR